MLSVISLAFGSFIVSDPLSQLDLSRTVIPLPSPSSFELVDMQDVPLQSANRVYVSGGVEIAVPVPDLAIQVGRLSKDRTQLVLQSTGVFNHTLLLPQVPEVQFPGKVCLKHVDYNVDTDSGFLKKFDNVEEAHAYIDMMVTITHTLYKINNVAHLTSSYRRVWGGGEDVVLPWTAELQNNWFSNRTLGVENMMTSNQDKLNPVFPLFHQYASNYSSRNPSARITQFMFGTNYASSMGEYMGNNETGFVFNYHTGHSPQKFRVPLNSGYYSMDIWLVLHEMGHNLGSGHSWSYSNCPSARESNYCWPWYDGSTEYFPHPSWCVDACLNSVQKGCNGIMSYDADCPGGEAIFLSEIPDVLGQVVAHQTSGQIGYFFTSQESAAMRSKLADAYPNADSVCTTSANNKCSLTKNEYNIHGCCEH